MSTRANKNSVPLCSVCEQVVRKCALTCILLNMVSLQWPHCRVDCASFGSSKGFLLLRTMKERIYSEEPHLHLPLHPWRLLLDSWSLKQRKYYCNLRSQIFLATQIFCWLIFDRMIRLSLKIKQCVCSSISIKYVFSTQPYSNWYFDSLLAGQASQDRNVCFESWMTWRNFSARCSNDYFGLLQGVRELEAWWAAMKCEKWRIRRAHGCYVVIQAHVEHLKLNARFLSWSKYTIWASAGAGNMQRDCLLYLGRISRPLGGKTGVRNKSGRVRDFSCGKWHINSPHTKPYYFHS